MMQKLWQKKLKLNYSKDVLDIVQFGSSINEEKPNDLDIAIFFNKIPLKEQLVQAQDIKKQIQKFSDIPVHIISFDFYTFFNDSNFSRENILFYGKSIIYSRDFAENFGLKPRIQISYSLKNLKKKDKIRFHYMLKGKAGSYGLLRSHGGGLINPGLIEILPEYENIFVNSIKQFNIKFDLKKVLLG